MSVSIKIIDAFRNQNIPERFLSSASESMLGMFENQVCVSLRAYQESFNYSAKYEIEDEIRNLFMDKIYKWIKANPAVKPWSIVSHGTQEVVNKTEFVCVLGFIFVDRKDSETFLNEFVIVEKLTN